MPLFDPWSKKHKRVTKASSGGMPYSLSNSFAEPLSHPELVHLARERGDKELIAQYDNHSLEYTPNGGSLDLRQEIAKRYGKHITEDNILVFAGGQVALQTAALALSSECHTITFTPGYQSTVEAPTHAGSRVTRVELKASSGWQIDPSAVAEAIQPGDTRYMVINEPFNPAGTLMSKSKQSELVAVAAQHNIYLMCDEAYRLLEHDPADRLPSMCDAYDRGISCVTMSKPWGACGVTIGWLAFQDLSIKQKLVDVQYFNTACPSRASEIQALMVLRGSDTILAKNLPIIRNNLERLDAFMARYPDLFSWVRPRAGAIAFLKFKGPLTSDELGQELAVAGISIKPSYCFTEDVTYDNDYFRVGFGEEKMPKALDALIAFVEQNKQRWREQLRSRL